MGNTEMYLRPPELAVAICGQKQSINDPDSWVRGRLSTVDLLALTSSDQLIFVLKILFTFSMEQPTLMWSFQLY
jgi:hypothetical protein